MRWWYGRTKEEAVETVAPERMVRIYIILKEELEKPILPTEPMTESKAKVYCQHLGMYGTALTEDGKLTKWIPPHSIKLFRIEDANAQQE